MKNSKISVLILAGLSSLSLFAAPADDKPQLSEYSKLKLPIVMINEAGRASEMNIDGIIDIDGVSNIKISEAANPEAAIYAPLTAIKFKFRFKNTDSVSKMFSNYSAQKYEDAVLEGRKVVYPAVVYMDLPERTTNVHYLLGAFVESLMRTERFIEAKALMEALPLARANATVGKAVADYIKFAIQAGRYSDADDILTRLNFGGENLENIDSIMEAVDLLRVKGKTKEAAKWYTKLQSTPNNPKKDECTLWMAYCDFQEGKTISAQLFVDKYKDIKRDNPIYSLRSLISGMLIMTDKSKVPEALDQYAQGIVYGDISSAWADELFFNTAMAYKMLEKPATSNEIFNQLILLYPQSRFVPLAKKELVKIVKKAETVEE